MARPHCAPLRLTFPYGAGAIALPRGPDLVHERTADPVHWEWWSPGRYDADQTVAAFAARLKDAVDLDSVRHDLTGVVQRTLEPAHVSVWISRRGPGLS